MSPATHRATHLLALDQGTSSSRSIVFDQGGRIVGGSPDEFATFIRGAYDTWGEVVRATGMRLE